MNDEGGGRHEGRRKGEMESQELLPALLLTWQYQMSSIRMNLVMEELKVMRSPMSMEDWDTSADSES